MKGKEHITIRLVLDGHTTLASGEMPPTGIVTPSDFVTVRMEQNDMIQRIMPLLASPAHFLDLEITRWREA